MRRPSALVLMLMIGPLAQSQPTGGLSGSVSDADTGQPLGGATVEVLIGDTVIGKAADDDGTFRFSALPTGIHMLRIRHQGYAVAMVPAVWVRAGRTEVVDAALRRTAYALREVEVREAGPALLSTIGEHTITVEQGLRYPASFYDPARLAMMRPGVAGANDQANHFSVRGNGPTANAYLLEGAEIVNPNHLTNAGTASDLPTWSGGGVTILSAQMLGPSRLLTGGFGAAYGNALGGIMDMRLRRGSTDRRGFTAQAGLIGIDLSTEGPFATNGTASYLVNYRYSTLGILSAMGVDLGDERIGFQDLSFHVSLPMRRAALSLFGLGGTSENRHDALPDTAQWEFDKDGQDIDYTARVGAVGASLSIALGTNASWRTTVVASENDQARDSRTRSTDLSVIARSEAALYERKLTITSRVVGRWGTRLAYEAGSSAMERTVRKELLVDERLTGWLVRPFAQASYSLSERMSFRAGLAFAQFTANGNGEWEPRLSFIGEVGRAGSISLTAGQRSQLPNVQLFVVRPAGEVWDNRGIGPDRMQEIVLGYDHRFKPHLTLHAEAYLQQRDDVPIGDATRWVPPLNEDGSMLNAWDQPLIMELSPTGKATNKGVEVAFVHEFHGGFQYQLNASGFSSTYTGIDGRERGSRWNQGLIANAMAGHEFTKRTERFTRTWGVSLRANVMGGLRVTPIDEAQSFVSGGTVNDPTRPFSQALPSYQRIDLRIYLKREHARRSGQWSIDLQNVLNTRNEMYRYFDQRKGEVVTKYQLGLIPNLSYRIEF